VNGFTQFRRYESVSLGLDRIILLEEDQAPKNRYRILPDLPAPLRPILDLATKEPVDPKKLMRFFEMPREKIRDSLYRVTLMYPDLNEGR